MAPRVKEGLKPMRELFRAITYLALQLPVYSALYESEVAAMWIIVGVGICSLLVVTFFALMPWRQETRDEETT